MTNSFSPLVAEIQFRTIFVLYPNFGEKFRYPLEIYLHRQNGGSGPFITKYKGTQKVSTLGGTTGYILIKAKEGNK